MKFHLLILMISLVFCKSDSPFKIDLKNIKIPNLDLNIIPVNNPDSILSKSYLEKHDIEALKTIAQRYEPEPISDNDIVLMETSRGILKIKLFNKIAPNHCYNFKKLANSGFYDETYFHRIIKDFMVQGGDVNTRDNDYTNDGLGNPGWLIDEEFNKIQHKKGILSMARGSNVNSAGSQFFICSADAPWLDGKYTAFGEVVENLYAIDLLENTETDRTQMLRSCFSKIANGEDPEQWIMVKDGSKGILYLKISKDYSSKEEYRSYVRRQLNSNTPIAPPKIIKVRVVNQNDIK